MKYDNLITIDCPACGKEMRKLFISVHNFSLDICLDGCGGIFFGNRELKEFDEQHENIDTILAAIKDRIFDEVDETHGRICPVCAVNMHKNYTSPKKSIQIDECYTCGGKFLDAGELVRMRDEFKDDAERSAAAVDSFYKMYGAEMAKVDKSAEKARKVDTIGEALGQIFKSYSNVRFNKIVEKSQHGN